jgi:hypothetical protein
MALTFCACAPTHQLSGVIQRTEYNGQTVSLYFSNGPKSDFVIVETRILIEPSEALKASGSGTLQYYMLGLGKSYIGHKIQANGEVNMDSGNDARSVYVSDRSQLTILN